MGPTVRALFDISMLLAMTDAKHPRHAAARNWRLAAAAHGWASCPLTQNGFLRIVTQKAYSNPIALADALAILRRNTSRPDHEFWPDDVSLLDPAIVDTARILGHRQLTDVYLLALATRHGGRLVTLDTGISTLAVRGASGANLVVV